MKPKDLGIVSGRLCIVDNNIPDAFFTYENGIVTIIPNTEECRLHLDKDHYEEEISEWINGISCEGCFISFYRNTNFSHLITAPITLSSVSFITQIIIKSSSPVNIDSLNFDEVAFRGRTVDIIYPPSFAIKENHRFKDMQLDINVNLNHKFEHNININNQNIKFIYGVGTSNIRYVSGQVIDLKKDIHSYFKFKLDQADEFSNILKYYFYAKRLIEFCAAAQNITFDMILYQKYDVEINGEILPAYNKFNVYLEDGHSDYVNEKLQFIKVINLHYLDKHLPELIKLLNEDQSKPYLKFLPKRNDLLNQILYTDIIDICTSVDREFSRNNFQRNIENVTQAKLLTDELLKIIETHDCDEVVKTKARNILNSQLKAFSPSLKEKFRLLAEKYVKNIDELDKINKNISKFVNLRNDFAHIGFNSTIWNDSVKIYSNVAKLIYRSILSRAGFNDNEINSILLRLHM